MKFDNFPNHRILAFGDSNTYGYSPATDGRYGDMERWPRVLEQCMGSACTVIEEGLPGRTSVFEDPITEGLCGLDAIAPCMLSHMPLDTVVIMLGTNDTKERFGCNAGLIAMGIARLAKKALETPAWRGAPNLLVVCPTPIVPEYSQRIFYSAMGDGCAEKSAALAPALEPLVRELGCRFLDAGSVADVQCHQADGMHLTMESHAALARAVAAALA